ncbi:MAG: ABC transporter ATP-binding protein [Alphaproteobacteria bacterium]|nr:ABC transporter ATP-binding protein [Alphaproteobacteria bacterium]
MSEDLFLYLSKHSVQFFSDNMAGALANKSNALAQTASGSYEPFLFYLTKIGALLFTFVLLLTVNFLFAFVFLGLVLVSVVVLIKVGKKSVRLRQKMVNAKNKVAGNMIDALQNNFFVRLFNGFDYENKRAKQILEQESSITNKSVAMEMYVSSGQKLYFDVLYLLFLLYGFYLWRQEMIASADLVLIFMLLKDMTSEVNFLIHRGVIYSGVLSEIRENLIPFAAPHEIVDKKDAFPLRVKQGKIELKNVTFAYKGNKPVLQNFSLQIPAKQKLGIVGMSGSGKTTLINLIERFYDIQSGEILIDGQNTAHATQESLHKSVSLVSQAPALLERTISENIAYGKPKAGKQAIINAAKKAFAHEFILKLPQKYNTQFKGDNKLSGGQRQRIAIARAVLKDAPILILDEATSALDSESETYIEKAIEEIIKNKTVIAIAHRLSTLKNMDRIIVLEKGKIIEDGTPAALLKLRGKFYDFWKLQQMEEKKDEQ